MNGAELFVNCLEAEGVQYIFGVPGEETQDLLFALEESSIVFVPVRHEQGAAFMANVWGRLSGKAGVCLATLGPGATNLLTGVADAFLDKAPLVAITGQGSIDRLHHESHQVIDIPAMFAPVTKWNDTVPAVTVIPEMVRKAFKVAQTEKPGATHIELPEDLAGSGIGDLAPLDIKAVRRPAPNHKALRQSVKLIQGSQRPLILAGNGAIRNRSSKALNAMANDAQIPVATTFMGKGAVPADRPASLGSVGLGFKDYIIEAFEESDLIICIGYDIAEVSPDTWNVGKEKSIIHIDFEPSEVYTHYLPDVELIGDLADILIALTSQIDATFGFWASEVRQRILDSIQGFDLKADESLTVPATLNILADTLPRESILISDVGAHKMWIARNYQTYSSNGCIISNGLASMGIALPGAIAASMLHPDMPVVAVMGDGGAMMNIQELETAKRLGLRFTIIILNDDNYGLIEWKQEMDTGHSYGTRIGNPDFIKLAESFGIIGHKITTPNHLDEILKNQVKNPELLLVEIPVNTDFNQVLVDQLKAYFNK